ncbi:MAG TPA: hypothetical protein VFY12_03455 [Arenimonas sp.]|nr:hypothetical protein [Arenimonas sp.]
MWRLRLRLASDDAVYGEVLQRWSQALPESALCLSARARWHERRGELEQARLLAEQALASNPGLATAQLLLLRAEVASDPESALRRIARIRPREDDAAARRSLLAYRGLAADRLGRYADALADWSRMAMVIAASHPLPMPESAQLAPGGKVEGRLLWAPPGVAMEPVLSAVAQVAPERLLAERARAPQRREDGFGVRRFKPTHENAGSGERWQASLRALGHEPAQAIDWLPHFDGYTAAALSGAHTVACLIDPRDALLNWMVFGSTADYVFLPDSKQDADWMAQCLEALADHRDANPLAVTVLNIDTLAEQADSLAAQLQSALALSSAPDPSQLARSPESSPALPMRFPAGHWRHYREVLAEAFARLTPVAQRFGYPAE